MPPAGNLPSRDRAFLRLLAEAAATNPFSERYTDLLSNIAEREVSASSEEQFNAIVSRVSQEVHKLEAAGLANVQLFIGDDIQLVRRAMLFDVYHRFLPQLDRLIQDQIAAGDRPAPAAFAGEVLRILVSRGFLPEEALRYFAILYQIRRAFFFLDRGLIGSSDSMKRLRCHLWNNVFTHDIRYYEQHVWNRMEDFSTMLLGETGTGKGAAAAAIGRSGFIPFDEKKGAFAESFTRSFTALNLSQFPEALLESELFGHRKGAFTGAVEAHEGIFARCSPYGAIFLDEIGDASVQVQIKLLDVLQARIFSPVGSHERTRFRGRIIAATNKPLETLRKGGEFRDDFFYRLCSDIVEVPSLRQRIAEQPSELQDLVASIVQRITGEPSAVPVVLDVIHSSLGSGYSWPGNVRELEQAVRRIILTREYAGECKAPALDLCGRLQSGINEGTLDANALLSGYCTLLYKRLGTYEEVARRTGLDRRTVKSYIEKMR